MSEAKKVCNCCHGEGFVFEKLRNHARCEYVEHLLTCDQCEGKGYTDETDSLRYYRSMIGERAQLEIKASR